MLWVSILLIIISGVLLINDGSWRRMHFDAMWGRVHYNDVKNEPDGVSNHLPHDCLLNRLFRRRPKKTSKLRVTGLCAGNSAGTGEFPAQRANYAETASIWWRHHDK